ncbi:PREDICTED: centrosomal protein kizuna [Eurypyga helias]|uniref:centrosomal protein kizuna n=1 Tax=Eurypyga helias TaxID=54383 RepID=UPI0005285638|nr:PREDICTED: centrosomal protein kizuna [Eurypyga helias]
MEYRKSDAYLMKLKYMKLKKYLEEIGERQKGAFLRNQMFLREFDRFEAHMRTSSSAMIQKMEAWYRREMRSVLSPQERNVSAEGAKAEEHAEQLSRVARPTGIGTRKALPRGLDHPAKTFIGRHASATGDLGTQEHPQPTESCSVPDLPSLSPSREGASPESGSADLERDALVEGAVRHGDLAASKEGSERLVSSAPGPKPDTPEEEGLQGSIPAPKPRLSNWWTKEGSWESSAELLVPVSPKEVTPSTPHVPQGTASPAADWEQDRDAHATEVSPLRPPSPPIVLEEPSLSSAPDGYPRLLSIRGHRGVLAGLSCALQLIEQAVRTSPRRQGLYQGKHTGTMGAAELLSFCDGAGTLKENLEVCEAVVLHQSAPNGCLLPEKMLDAEGRVAEREGTSYQRPEQQWDVDALRTRFASHALLLRTHGAQLPEEAAALFDSLQDPGGKVLEDQALPTLGEVLLGDHVARSPPQSNESSYSSPLIPNGGGERKEAERAPWLADTGEQEVTSWCEDESKKGSTAAEIPITGWDSSDDSCQGKRSQETHSESGSSWSERSPVFSRTETRKGMAAAIKSKAFWGESDDSCSEIEAALCPPAHSTEADEFDDFYD